MMDGIAADERARADRWGRKRPFQSGMGRAEMAVWLCVMAILAIGMLAILALASR